MIKAANSKKEVSTKLMKGLLDLIILQFLNNEPMHGYQVITQIRKSFDYTSAPAPSTPYWARLKRKDTLKANGT